ncbi:MAG: hypothetical protein ACRD6X_00715 [Pyrinomonadaceae bacterium]
MPWAATAAVIIKIIAAKEAVTLIDLVIKFISRSSYSSNEPIKFGSLFVKPGLRIGTFYYRVNLGTADLGGKTAESSKLAALSSFLTKDLIGARQNVF